MMKKENIEETKMKSNNTKKEKNKKKVDKRELTTKIMAAIMAFLMLLAVCSTLIFYLL